MLAHFGLGEHTQVDRLEVHWPSGQVDVLGDTPADQRIRLTEGQETYHTVHPTLWQEPLPTLAVSGDRIRGLHVRPALFAAEARITRIAADLSAFGGPVEAPLTPVGDGSFRLNRDIAIAGEVGPRVVAVHIEQETATGAHWTRLSRVISVVPSADQPILDDAIATSWQLDASRGAAVPIFTDDLVHSGKRVAVHGISIKVTP